MPTSTTVIVPLSTVSSQNMTKYGRTKRCSIGNKSQVTNLVSISALSTPILNFFFAQPSYWHGFHLAIVKTWHKHLREAFDDTPFQEQSMRHDGKPKWQQGM